MYALKATRMCCKPVVGGDALGVGEKHFVKILSPLYNVGCVCVCVRLPQTPVLPLKEEGELDTRRRMAGDQVEAAALHLV